MRGFARCAAVGTFVAITGIYVWAQAPAAPAALAKDAGPVMTAAREALGGEKKLSAVKTFTASGRTRQVRGENLVPIEFEIFVELPDKYVRKDEIPAQETGVTAAGFNGDDLLQEPPPPPMPVPPAGAPAAGPGRGPAGPPRNPSAARVTSLKQDFARLTLGMFATSFSGYPLTFSYVGEAEAPQGKADVVDAKGPGNFTLRLFIAKDTHLPIMVSWQGAPPGRGAVGAVGAAGPRGAGPTGAEGARGAGAPGAPGGAGAPGARPDAPGPGPGPGAQPPASAPENRLYFADYRDVDGLQFPFRLRRAVGADTIEETTFDRYKVNAKIDPKRFEVRK
jgi:hypothetical protein